MRMTSRNWLNRSARINLQFPKLIWAFLLSSNSLHSIMPRILILEIIRWMWTNIKTCLKQRRLKKLSLTELSTKRSFLFSSTTWLTSFIKTTLEELRFCKQMIKLFRQLLRCHPMSICCPQLAGSRSQGLFLESVSRRSWKPSCVLSQCWGPRCYGNNS